MYMVDLTGLPGNIFNYEKHKDIFLIQPKLLNSHYRYSGMSILILLKFFCDN